MGFNKCEMHKPDYAEDIYFYPLLKILTNKYAMSSGEIRIITQLRAAHLFLKDITAEVPMGANLYDWTCATMVREVWFKDNNIVLELLNNSFNSFNFGSLVVYFHENVGLSAFLFALPQEKKDCYTFDINTCDYTGIEKQQYFIVDNIKYSTPDEVAEVSSMIEDGQITNYICGNIYLTGGLAAYLSTNYNKMDKYLMSKNIFKTINKVQDLVNILVL